MVSQARGQFAVLCLICRGLFSPLISVIKARSCHSSRSNRRSSIQAPPPHSHLPPLPCLALLMLSGATLQLGGGTCEGNTRPGAGLSPFPGIRRRRGAQGRGLKAGKCGGREMFHFCSDELIGARMCHCSSGTNLVLPRPQQQPHISSTAKEDGTEERSWNALTVVLRFHGIGSCGLEPFSCYGAR